LKIDIDVKWGGEANKESKRKGKRLRKTVRVQNVNIQQAVIPLNGIGE